MNKTYNVLFLIFMIIILCLYLSNTIENFDGMETVPAIMLMRHGKEFDNISQIPAGGNKTYKFLNNSIELTHDQQTISTNVCYGIPAIEALYNKIKTKIEGKYKPIDTIITINPFSSGNDAPTKNPFLTAYHFAKGDADDTIQFVQLFDSKDKNYGRDGYNNINILPDTLEDYIKSTQMSVLVIVTRDTLWGDGNQGLVNPDQNRLLSLYKKYYNTKSVVYPYKAQTVHVFSGVKNSGKLDIFEFLVPNC